ncbi:MAG: membrane protein insertase YidC [Deltaproteobacteria bacterium]|nr:membrane protein insertase YidC [Deltaproteobacteria bacterium]
MSMQPGGMLPGLEPQGPDTKRLLVTVTLVTLVWAGFQMLAPKAPPPPPPEATPAATPAPLAAAPAELSAPSGTPDLLPEEKRSFSANVAAAMTGAGVGVKGGYRAELTSHGAQISSFQLDGYQDVLRKDKATGVAPPIDLAAAGETGSQSLALRSRGGTVALAANAPYEVVEENERGAAMSRVTPSGVRVTRRYSFDPARFAFTHTIELKNESAAPQTASLDLVLTGMERPGERDQGGMFNPTPDALAGVCMVAGSRETFTSREVEKEPEKFDGAVTYAGIDRHYFLGAVVLDAAPTQRCAAKPITINPKEVGGEVTHGLEIVLELKDVTLAPGEVKSLEVLSYFGPKQVGLLQEFGHELAENINFGIFGVLSRPMLWVLVQLYKYLGNFGVAIILLTLLMKALTFPLTQKSYVSMQQIKKIKPEVDELTKKYGHDRTVLGQKQMELYKEKGINPLAGCFPVLVQMPIWFALYRTLSQAVELYQQPFAAAPWTLGILDLTQPDMLLPFGISLLPLIVGALMLFQTWLQPPPSDQPQMKYMMWGMPVFFSFLMLSMASGLSIYMITNSLLTMAQQLYIKKKYA